MIDRPLRTTALVALAAALLAPALPARAAAPSATTYYEAAIAAMQRLPEPPAAIFTTTFHSQGLAFGLGPLGNGSTAIFVNWGGDMAKLGQQRYRTWMRARGDRTLNVDAKGTRYYSTSPVFVPTWPGAYDFLRYGWDGKPAPSKPLHPIATPPPGLKTIAVVSAISPGAYRIEDRGAALCPDGSPGHALHLTALYDPSVHTLSQVVIDAKTMRICSLRFNIFATLVALSLGGYVQMNFGEVGKYWIVRNSKIEIAIHTFAIQVKHGSATIAYTAMNFPKSIPFSMVTPPTPP
ncbi:MAG: hypothetical protein ACP5O6_11350, partial [Candidatus Baltobacteraceae bacterium]